MTGNNNAHAQIIAGAWRAIAEVAEVCRRQICGERLASPATVNCAPCEEIAERCVN